MENLESGYDDMPENQSLEEEEFQETESNNSDDMIIRVHQDEDKTETINDEEVVVEGLKETDSLQPKQKLKRHKPLSAKIDMYKWLSKCQLKIILCSCPKINSTLIMKL